MNTFESRWLENLETIFNRVPNSTDSWFPSDTDDLFESNLKKYPDSPHLNFYKNNPIYYEYNNYGFRTTDDFNLEENGNVYLGCSHTFGVGHNYLDMWSYKLHKKIGKGKFYNISEPSSGLMTQYRYLKYFSDKIKFENVFHFLPSECWNRYEFTFNGNPPELLDYKEKSKHLKKYSNFITDVLLYDENMEFINSMCIDAIKNICKENGAEYYLITDGFKVENVDPYHKFMRPARDLMHYYVEEHDELSDLFLEKYQQNNTNLI